MPHFEYKVIPAPMRAERAKGVKSPEGRFAHTIEGELNRMGEAGWEYLRAELLPHEETSRLKAAQTKWRTMLIFRRSRDSEAEAMHARVVDPLPADPAPVIPPPLVAIPPEPLLAEDPTVVPLPPRVEDDDTPQR